MHSIRKIKLISIGIELRNRKNRDISIRLSVMIIVKDGGRRDKAVERKVKIIMIIIIIRNLVP